MIDNLVYISEYLEDFLPDLEIISSLFHSIECGESNLDYCYLIIFFSKYIPYALLSLDWFLYRSLSGREQLLKSSGPGTKDK